ncbi:glycerol-3-phosphate dehydrogenase/oxidase [Albibacterium bauzanense]|uniref:Glycerol-3-phosphate dehydrogenase n=1 Tax=Albibacterium bauzanense TaxID=653929 RepID=A0A4R1LXH3_9SPHI|nr:glycerol-3-phosphate dehydrogenase/oxidase [Albibacterium bauzanense]TCK83612.1 glycerol-3-phosphate dehydrogenase [Albibacterium bauzanense]
MTSKQQFNRASSIAKLNEGSNWDILIIGGGATGLGAAVDAASRGYKTLLLEQADFSKGTSSRSTKLVHGGVRYLAQGNISLVREALKERGLLFNNAPHLVKKQKFIIPCYDFFSKAKYLIGLKIYDLLAGKYSFGKSTLLSKKELLSEMPQVEHMGLTGGVGYFDGQFDDSRLAINLAQTCAEQGGTLINYVKVIGLLKDKQGLICGVKAVDEETKEEYTIHSKIVINATGVFVDEILQMDIPNRKPLVRPSQGTHIVLNKSFLRGGKAMMIPKTSDGRVLFAVPWHNHIILGTTDTPLNQHSLEPTPLEEEITFILKTADQYLTSKPQRSDVLSVFAGLRPLAVPDKDTNTTKEISRSHKLIVENSKLITITGGKWTTYRKMGEDTINKAISIGKLPSKACQTKGLRIHGYNAIKQDTYRGIYGADSIHIEQLEKENPQLSKPLLKGEPYTLSEVIWAARHEMAQTVEDVLARRMRLLFLDAKEAASAAKMTAEVLGEELGKSAEWKQQQVNNFVKLTKKYTLH